jgi:arylsulfatase A-like enzyme
MVSAFKRAGYFTKAFSANPMLSPAYGTDRGFHEASWPLLGADELEERASRWLRAHRREPFFLLVFILDPHFPYSPPADLGLRFVRGNGQERVGDSVSDLGLVKSGDLTPEERARVIDLYDAEIAWADRALSRLLATLRSLDIGSHTVVAVTADHGEEFWDHGGFFHGHSLHQELLRVPLIVSVPWRAGESSVVREPVSLLDIAPTLLELAGLAPPAGMSGRSLAASFDGQKLPLHPCPAGAILYGDDMRALRLGKHKVLATLEGLPTALFDLAADPYETVNILASERALAESLASVIGSFAAAPPGSLEAVAPEPDEATQQALEALGYL